MAGQVLRDLIRCRSALGDFGPQPDTMGAALRCLSRAQQPQAANPGNAGLRAERSRQFLMARSTCCDLRGVRGGVLRVYSGLLSANVADQQPGDSPCGGWSTTRLPAYARYWTRSNGGAHEALSGRLLM
jgi:hypothetical protein